MDFEYAGLEDPLYGWAKYTVYDIDPLDKAGVVDAFLVRTGFSRADFALRLGVCCLWTLQNEINPKSQDGETLEYRNRVLGLLNKCIGE